MKKNEITESMDINKLNAWGHCLDELKPIFTLTSDDDPRYEELGVMVDKMEYLYQQEGFDANQIQALTQLIKASYEAGRKDTLNEKE